MDICKKTFLNWNVPLSNKRYLQRNWNNCGFESFKLAQKSARISCTTIKKTEFSKNIHVFYCTDFYFKVAPSQVADIKEVV